MASFGASLKRIRLHLGLNQDDFAERLRTTRRTIVRWETGDAVPLATQHAFLFEYLEGVRHDLLRPLADALGHPLPALPGEVAAVRDDLHAHLYALSEAHDLSPRRLRHAVLSVLDRGARLGLSLDQVRGFLAQAPPRTKAV